MPLTLSMLLDNEWITPWKPSGDRMMKRGFYQSHHWMAARNLLSGRNPDAMPADRGNDREVDLSAIDLSIRGRLDGLVETFVAGWPRAELVRPQGYGMEPPFQRMRPPHKAVVEMRTTHTRTFGFFVRQDNFVAWTLQLADDTHAAPQRYSQNADAVMQVVARMSSTDIDMTSDVEELIG